MKNNYRAFGAERGLLVIRVAGDVCCAFLQTSFACFVMRNSLDFG